jgi:phosphatidylserine decarboxylase
MGEGFDVRIARGGWSHIIAGLLVLLAGVGAVYGLHWPVTGWVLIVLGVVLTGFMVYFFRDPDRDITTGDDVVVAGADGWVRAVEPVQEQRFLKRDTVRICTFLTPFDVHVNRAPVQGKVTALAYTPGKHILTIQQAASEHNEHSSILIEGQVPCLVKQIVGPLVRRVVYWLDEGQALAKGERIGLMKFGSRLDVYLPRESVEVMVKRGDRVFAGRTVIAKIRK